MSPKTYEQQAYYADRLSAYFDGELSAKERLELEDELEQNADLRSELNAFKRLSNQLHVDDVDRQAAQNISATFKLKRKAHRKRRLLWLQLAPVGAALVLLAVLIIPQVQPQPSITQDELFMQYAEAVTALGN